MILTFCKYTYFIIMTMYAIIRIIVDNIIFTTLFIKDHVNSCVICM